MGLRSTNRLFHRTPYTLLRIPEYMRLFDGATRGAMYRLLCSRIYRGSVDKLLYVNPEGYLTQLAEAYDNGLLCAYFTDAELMESLGFKDERTVRNTRAELVDLKLVRFTKFKDGYLYQLGKRLKDESDDGYSIGAEHEAYFIDSWVTMAEDNPLKLRKQLITELASEEVKKTLLERLKKDEAEAKPGKILPSVWKDFSENDDEVTLFPDAPGEEKTAKAHRPIEDNDIGSTSVRSKEKRIAFSERQKHSGVLKNTDDFYKAQKAARRLHVLGVPLEETTEMLRKKLDEAKIPIRHGLPRYTYALNTVSEDTKSSTPKLVMRVWNAIREDLTGYFPGDNVEKTNDFDRQLKFVNDALVKSNAKQIYWTMDQILKTSKEDAMFLIKDAATITHLVGKYAAKYREFVQAQERERAVEQFQKAKSENENVTEETTVKRELTEQDMLRLRRLNGSSSND